MTAQPTSETSALLNEAGLDGEYLAIAKSQSEDYGTTGAEEAILIKSPEQDTTWRVESKLLAKYSAPLIVTYFLQYSFNLVSVFVAGRLGTYELGAISLASMTANITGFCVYEGLATSLDTLTSQAFGNGKKHLVGLHVQRMIILVWLTTIPIGILWMCSPWILVRLIPDSEKETAEMAGTFLRIAIAAAPGYGCFEAGKRFAQAQGNFNASLIVILIAAPINVFLNWFLVFYLNLKFIGAALAYTISVDLQPIILLFHLYFFAPSTHQCWPGLQLRRACQSWGPMVQLAVPGVLMVLSEWLAFDILTFSSSYISSEHLAAQSVLMTVCVTIYHIPFPISIAASTRFGNLIGYGALKAARTTWRTYYVIFIGIGIFDMAMMTSLRHEIATVFSDDPKVQEIITSVMPVVAAAQCFDATAAITNGLLRGLGRQKIGGLTNLAVYYLFGLPLSFLMVFGPPKLALAGLWIGPCSGLGLVSIILTLYMRFADWSKAVEDARTREE